MSADPYYCYPGTDILRNLLDIRNARLLDEAERLLVGDRLIDGTPPGNFDLAHLQAIHRHLFQDIYACAGELRRVEIAKDDTQFMPYSRIALGMEDIHRRLSAYDFLRTASSVEFAEKAAEIVGDVNHVHPFREGNGRTQIEYLRQLARQAGHDFSATRLDPDRWIAASRAAHFADYAPMRDQIAAGMDAIREGD